MDEESIKESGAEIFYANVDMTEDGKMVTGTSRSIGIVGIGETIEEAEQRCEDALKFVEGDAICVRHDIGKRDLIQKRIDRIKNLLS